jgi:Mg-chelatase subunit ChlD
VWLVPHTSANRAPLQENRQQVLLELIGASPTGERLGLDLVAVLDVSGSMEMEDRIDKMKTAMQFVIKKLSPIDRLSIVAFSDDAERLCHLRSVTQDSQAHLKYLVDRLRPINCTNIQAGLETGLKVLNDRRIAGGRVASIFLLSDGEQNVGDATTVDVSDVAVYTFGFGAGSNHKVREHQNMIPRSFPPLID